MIFNNKWKSLYETEVENRKKYEKRYREIKKENEALQVKQGYAELRQKLDKLTNDNFDLTGANMKLKEELARVKIELEDNKGFLAQETQAKEALKKERANLKREIARLKRKIDDMECDIIGEKLIDDILDFNGDDTIKLDKPISFVIEPKSKRKKSKEE